MHIVVDARKAFDSGIGTYIRHVVPGVVEALGDCAFTVLTSNGAIPDGLRDRSNVRCHACAVTPLALSEQWQLRTVFSALAPVDLLWATSLAHPLGIRTPLIATVHDVIQVALRGREGTGLAKRMAARVLLNSIRSRADLLIFNSEYTRSEFGRCLGQPRCPAVVTPLGVDASWFEHASAARTACGPRPYLICVSSWRPHKNLTLLLSAFAAVRDRVRYDLVVIGAEAGSEAFNGVELEARVRWHRFVPEETLKAWVRGADAMVLPSLYEGFGLPALEALAAGCPVLASDIGAFREVCGDAATYFDPRQVGSLEAAIVSLAHRGTNEIEECRQRGIDRARSFTWKATIDLTAGAIAMTVAR